ncbi:MULTISPECIES: hypothetical protein [unclassified Rhizobium]|uniref:hypothetical protein n=1 Tax=unclassified Rhizobium TaxID=2613769 RepID=UPI0011604AFE|nr:MULTISPECIES: hypothetical protein [unclassified Rhizobium]TQX85339.1 hypothetical protein EQW76_21585 [Rhizobium sp. rho-13.1]TQY09856.1 hypothetical protein EQW74_21210 [Rhizobium sp. rho-1.1]
MKQKTLGYRLMRRVRSLPAESATRLLAMPAINSRLTRAYEAAQIRYRPSIPKLSSPDMDIVIGLEQNGVYITSLEKLNLPGTDILWNSATGIAEQYSARASKGEFADEYTVQVSAEHMMRHPEIVRFPLNDRILNVVETYLGLPAAYDTLNFFYTVADGRQVAARKWHRDVEDRRMVKMIVYLHDVDLDTGPIEILHYPFPGSDKLRGANFPVLTHEMLLDQVGKPLGSGDMTTCTGKAGTVIFTDVASHYHRGRPAKARDRCALFYNFFSQKPLRPFFCGRHVFSHEQISNLASGQTTRARTSMLWRANLSWLARVVPAAPL